MTFFFGFLLGIIAWLFVRVVFSGFYTVEQNERAVVTSFGRADRIDGRYTASLPMAQYLRADERERYAYPQVHVIQPGGPYFKWPWQKIHKVSIATNTVSIAQDVEQPLANESGQRLEAVTKDHLNTKLRGQIRFRVSEQNLYAYFFGVHHPFAHVMGYFVSILREKVASFESSDATTSSNAEDSTAVQGVSINDLRKNLRMINDSMDQECKGSSARYGVEFDACLITEIDPPDEVESALAAINTAYNHVSSEVSLAQAAADQRIVQSKRAVEIEMLRVQAEVEPIRTLADQLMNLHRAGPRVLSAYVRNVRLTLLDTARRIIAESDI